MPKEPTAKDLGAVWRGQPEENLTVGPVQFVSRRTRLLSYVTRSEIGVSIGAALLFVALVGLRFASAHDRIGRLELASAIVVAAWALISAYMFRKQIWSKDSQQDLLAANCRDYYRKALERRRDHLRNEWLWHGPLVLAVIVSFAVFNGIGHAFPDWERMRGAAPLLALLIGWTALSIRSRRRQANEIQREIDEIDQP